MLLRFCQSFFGIISAYLPPCRRLRECCQLCSAGPNYSNHETIAVPLPTEGGEQAPSGGGVGGQRHQIRHQRVRCLDRFRFRHSPAAWEALDSSLTSSGLQLADL